MTTPAGHGSPDGAGTAAASAVATRGALLEAREVTKHFPAGRGGAEPARTARRLPVPPTLPARDGSLLATPAAVGRGRARARQRLLAARPGAPGRDGGPSRKET